MEMEREVYFLPNKKNISLLVYIFLLIQLRLFISTGTHTRLAVWDTWAIHSLLCLLEKPVYISGKSPRRCSTREVKEGVSVFFVFSVLP